MQTDPIETAISGFDHIPDGWMSAAQVAPFIFEDPGVVWLEFHGQVHGFTPDQSDYEFLDFVGGKAHEFELKWLQEMAPQAVIVCQAAADVRRVEKVRQTFELMQQGIPVIARPALWWAPERIYGIPDLLVHSTWLQARFPDLLPEQEAGLPAPNLGPAGARGHYRVLDLKFTTKLDARAKAKDLENYAAQMRIYTYMVGQLQGGMPEAAYLIARDRVAEPLPVAVSSGLDRPLDEDLAAIRDHFTEIKLNGDQFRPWQDDMVAINMDHNHDRWRTAKCQIAQELVPGGDTSLMYYVGQRTKRQLAELGFPNLESLLNTPPGEIPFEDCKGIGAKTAGRMRAILQANQTGAPVVPPPDLIPPPRPYEFYVDYEYFTNMNVDFEHQWPGLEGQEMIFMVGIGWLAEGEWQYTALIAESESPQGERRLLDQFWGWLDQETGGAWEDREQTALYHWSGAEVWQSRRAAERHQLPENHALHGLPWVDLSKVFLEGPGAVPGSWGFGLKEMTRALGDFDPAYAVTWPGELDEGLRVMVMGLEAYRNDSPSEIMPTINQYLEADCQALAEILRWLRSQ